MAAAASAFADFLIADGPAPELAGRIGRYGWLGEHSRDGGATWRLQADFRARRSNS